MKTYDHFAFLSSCYEIWLHSGVTRAFRAFFANFWRFLASKTLITLFLFTSQKISDFESVLFAKIHENLVKMQNQAAVEALYSATFVEDYLDCVENLPNDLQRHLSRLREFDLIQYNVSWFLNIWIYLPLRTFEALNYDLGEFVPFISLIST